MALHKVPGSKSYMADDAGFREILATPKAGAVALSAARGLADAAGSNYTAEAATVTAGWGNESRAGAVVREVTPSASDARNRALLKAAELMGRRS